MHLCRSCSHVPRLPTFLNCCKTFEFCSLLGRCRIPCACHAKRHLNVQKWSEHVVRFCVFSMLTWKCASRHNGVHFFDMSTSKSGPSIGNVLRATTACTFSTSQLLEVPRSWGVLRILTSKCASRTNGVQCSISYLTTWLRARHFSEPTFWPSWATNHWKTLCFATLLPFAHRYLSRTCIFFLLTLSLLWSSFFCSSLTLPTSAFPSVHIVGSLTSKLPSMNAFRCLPGWFAACLTSPCFTLSIVRFSIISLRWQTFTQGCLWNRVLQCFDVGSCLLFTALWFFSCSFSSQLSNCFDVGCKCLIRDVPSQLWSLRMPKFIGMPRRSPILWKRSVDLLGIPAATQWRVGFWLLPRSKNI